LQVRSSPRKARAKAPATKKTKKQQTQFPSTNISSPVRAPKQKIRSFAYNGDDDDEDDAFDAPRHPTRTKAARGYQADGFVVDDEAGDDFAPVRVAKPLRPTKAKGLGAPITSDSRISELTELQSDVLRDFMEGAKKLRKGIQEKKNHREAIFTDTVLREMGLELPQNLNEMKTLPGIRPEMVDLYGKHFLSLINNTRNYYGDETPVSRNPLSRNRQVQRQHIVHEVSDDDEEVDDQNHRLVVDLCSDEDEEEEEAPMAVEDSESEFSYGGEFDDDDDDDDGVVHTSHHFGQNQDPQVAEFNNRYTQLGGGAPPKPTKASARGGGAGSKAPYKKKGSSRRKSSNSFGGNKSYGGVKKRAAKATGSRTSGGGATATAARKPPGGGGRGAGGAGNAWGSIMAMPT
jgi:bloom syndrome protein